LEGSDLSTLKRDDLYPRFEKLFKEFFGSPVSFEIVIEPDELRPLFYHFWDQKVLPSKEILVQAVRIKPTSLVSMEKIGDHVLSTFAMALEKLRIEEDYKPKGAETTSCEESSGNVFHRNGDVWIIMREGKEFPYIKHESGMSLISHVLYHRGTVFQSPLDLEAAIDGSQAGSSVLSDMTQEQLEKEGFGTQGLVDRIGADKTALQAYKKQLDEISNLLHRDQ